MDERIKNQLLEKNDKLINMVIERAKRDFPDDIAIIGLTGSFSTNDFHEKSDLDLIIINNTDRGWEISHCFILEDVGYDIYCTPWETRIAAASNLESPYVSHLVDLKILYSAKEEYIERFHSYRQRALDELAKPIGKECLDRAKKDIDLAKQSYTNTLLVDDLGLVRVASGEVLHCCMNALTSLNNTYFKRGIKRYLEDTSLYLYKPEDFELIYESLLDAKTTDEIRNASFKLLKSITDLSDKMIQDLVKHPTPTYDNLKGTYEELWCNCRNKIITSVDANDKSYAFYAALGAQRFLDEMSEMIGTKKFDLMQYFDADNLNMLKEEFLRIMDEYLEEYNIVGRKVVRYETLEELTKEYLYQTN